MEITLKLHECEINTLRTLLLNELESYMSEGVRDYTKSILLKLRVQVREQRQRKKYPKARKLLKELDEIYQKD